MAEYGAPIRVAEYKYHKTIKYYNTENYVKNNVVLKLLLSRNNFNFDLPKDDGSDFRIVFNSGTLKMWNAFWSKTQQRAVLFFMVPHLGANRSFTFNVYWGNPNAVSVSEPEAMDFLFYENFDSSPLDNTKWTGRLTNSVTTYGYYVYYYNYPFISITNPLEGKTSFKAEFGIYTDWDTSGFSGSLAAIGVSFLGTENNFKVRMTSGRVDTNAVVPNQSSYNYKADPYGFLEPRSYHDVLISYSEDEDRVYLRLFNRDSFPDYDCSWPRKVEGDTRPQNISIDGYVASGNSSGAHPTYISWLALREYEAEDIDLLDASGLYIDHEYVPAQVLDIRDFSDDITSIVYYHESSFGGDPYLLSEGGYESNDNVWVSDEDATVENYVALTIHTGFGQDVTSTKYIHYDSGHTYHYGAVRLSDNDQTQFGWTFTELTTSSGWVAIKFPTTRTIGTFRIKNTNDLDAAPKDYIFYGSNFNPAIAYENAHVLSTGTFSQTEEWQFDVLLQGNKYRYYILEILNTHGGDNIKIQEWELMDSMEQRDRRYPVQLRLHPAIQGDLQYNFPKEISLVATNDGVNWDTLIPWRYTYTPFISHYPEYGLWQRYSFIIEKGYWTFRLLCRGNWRAQDNKIAIGEWELRELVEEAYTYHILAGSTNDIQQVWSHPTATIDSKALFFVANDYVSRVSTNRLAGSDKLPDYYEDINVIQESF
jgi:hypothetical protein